MSAAMKWRGTPTEDSYAWNRLLRSDPNVTGATLTVALVMGTWANSKWGGRMWPGIALLAEQTGHSQGTVKKARKRLRALGYIVRTGDRVPGHPRAVVYRMAMPSCVGGQAKRPPTLATGAEVAHAVETGRVRQHDLTDSQRALLEAHRQAMHESGAYWRA